MEDDKSGPKLPIPGKRNILITSALPYVNNVPHLGNIIGCVLSADVYARYCRLRGYNALYICGTDEYGTATETKALEEKCTPREICDKYHAIHKEVYEWFDISFDKFGRTSTAEHTEMCQAIFIELWKNNLISEKTTEQLYCDTCPKFLADRLVEGSCPFCNSGSARGDQCDRCDKHLKPTELKDPKCKVCGTTPQIRNTNHLFIELPLLKDKLEKYIDETSVTGSWSQNAIQTTKAWLKVEPEPKKEKEEELEPGQEKEELEPGQENEQEEDEPDQEKEKKDEVELDPKKEEKKGLQARSITRDLKWGVPVPLEGYEDKVFYVWFDAPIGYISITSCYTSEWEKWWKNPENVELYQFMGKDNVTFHTVLFPSTQLGTEENWTMMKTISVTEHLKYKDGKFSKSKGVGVFGNDVKDTNIPVEVWRYYLLINRPEVSDAKFAWSDLQAKLNGELLSNLGNFVYRVLSFIAKPESAGYGSVIPDAPGAESHPLTKSLGEKVGNLVEKEYVEAMEKVKLKDGLKTAMNISSAGNAYLQATKFWKLYKEDKASCAVVIRSATGLVHLLAQLLEPFMPSFSREVFKQLNLAPQFSLSDERGEVLQASRPWEILPPSHRIGTPQPLFKELKDEEVEQYIAKFDGSQAERLAREAEAASKSGSPT